MTSEVQCTVSAYRVYRLLFICQFCLHIVFLSCWIVYHCVLLFSFTRCGRHSVCQCLLLGRFFSVRFCSSTCIWGVVLILLRRCPHVVSRLCPCFCFVLIFYLFWGFSLVFYFKASSSYFILRLCPDILFWGFVLIFYIEASSSLFYIVAIFLSLRLWSSLL